LVFIYSMSLPLISERAEKALRDIGLTEYETLAYLSLLKSGQMTAESVSQASSIPYTKVYGVLEGLEERSWVEIEGGRPRKYYARSPIDALMAERNRLEAEFEDSRRVLVDELQPLYERSEVKEIPEIWIIRGEGNSFNKILELLAKARKEIMLAVPWVPDSLFEGDRSFGSALNEAIRKFMDSGISIKLLTTEKAFKSMGAYELGLAEVRVCDSMFGGGLVIDGRESIIFLDLAKPLGVDTAIWSEHETLTSVASIYFQHVWDNSKPLKELK
jgi:sugar-specific transcriptional regulator TrmB